MLQASLHNKNGHEDNLTSSSLGILQFLPGELFLRVLKGACGNQSSFPSDFGGILSFSFWPKLSANGTYNSLSVEPDLWIQTEQYHISRFINEKSSIIALEEFIGFCKDNKLVELSLN